MLKYFFFVSAKYQPTIYSFPFSSADTAGHASLASSELYYNSPLNNQQQQQTKLVASVTRMGGVPTLMGVVSWGMGCGRPAFAGVYTDVRIYRGWVHQAMGGDPGIVWT